MMRNKYEFGGVDCCVVPPFRQKGRRMTRRRRRHRRTAAAAADGEAIRAAVGAPVLPVLFSRPMLFYMSPAAWLL